MSLRDLKNFVIEMKFPLLHLSIYGMKCYLLSDLVSMKI